MKKNILLFTDIMLLCISAFSQTTDQKRFHATEGTEVEKLVKLPNGNLTILSSDKLFSTDSSGTVLWSRKIPPLSDGSTFSGTSFVRNGDGSYIIAGVYNINPWVYSSALVKTNSTGSVLWSKLLLGQTLSRADAIIKTSDGGFAIAGDARDLDSGKLFYDTYVIKLDSKVNFQWCRILGSKHNTDHGNAIIQTRDNGYVITGYTYFNGASDMFVAKLNTLGNLLWSKHLGDGGYDVASGIIETRDGGLLALGDHGTEPSLGYTTDYFLAKLNSAGLLEWAKYYGGTSFDYAYGVAESSDGNYVVTGTSYSFRSDFYSDIYSIKVNTSGDLLVSKAVDGWGSTIVPNEDGFIIGGYDVHDTPRDGLLIHTDNDLNICNSRNVPTVVSESTRSANTNYRQKNIRFTALPLSYKSVTFAISETELCSASNIANIGNSNSGDLTISIFPNPAKDKLVVKLDGVKPSLIRLNVMDVRGNVFISKITSVSAQQRTEMINTSFLKKGSYFLAVVLPNGTKKLMPFIKE